MTSQHSIEPITMEEREWIKDHTLPDRFREELDALLAYEAALLASEQREKKLQAELDALNDDGALHTAYLSGQQDAKERISALEQREKKLREALEPFARLCQIGEPFSQNGNREVYGRNGTVLTSDDFRRARQALGE